MSEDTATIEYAAETKTMGDQIAGLTLKQAKELSDYLENEHGIKAAAGGGVVMAAPADGDSDGGPAAQSEFEVILTGFGDKKLDVVKAVKAITGAALMEAKKMVDGVPSSLKQGASPEEAEEIKKKIEEAGGAVELK